MSSSQTRSVIPGITETSSILEMMSVLKSSFEDKACDELGCILISRETKMKNKLWNLQEKYELLQQDHAKAVLQKLSALEKLEEYKVKEQEHSKVSMQLETVSEELINVSVQLETVNEERKEAELGQKVKQDLLDDISKLQEAVAKELEPSRYNSEKTEVEAKRAATTQEPIPLEVGAQNRTTVKDIDETDAPLSQVPLAKVEDEIDSDDESAIIAFSQKLKRARFC